MEKRSNLPTVEPSVQETTEISTTESISDIPPRSHGSSDAASESDSGSGGAAAEEEAPAGYICFPINTVESGDFSIGPPQLIAGKSAAKRVATVSVDAESKASSQQKSTSSRGTKRRIREEDETGKAREIGAESVPSEKRKNQMREAQRAFRERKERQLKSLEKKAEELDHNCEVKNLQNAFLRAEVKRLQQELENCKNQPSIDFAVTQASLEHENHVFDNIATLGDTELSAFLDPSTAPGLGLPQDHFDGLSSNIDDINQSSSQPQIEDPAVLPYLQDDLPTMHQKCDNSVQNTENDLRDDLHMRDELSMTAQFDTLSGVSEGNTDPTLKRLAPCPKGRCHRVFTDTNEVNHLFTQWKPFKCGS